MLESGSFELLSNLTHITRFPFRNHFAIHCHDLPSIAPICVYHHSPNRRSAGSCPCKTSQYAPMLSIVMDIFALQQSIHCAYSFLTILTIQWHHRLILPKCFRVLAVSFDHDYDWHRCPNDVCLFTKKWFGDWYCF